MGDTSVQSLGELSNLLDDDLPRKPPGDRCCKRLWIILLTILCCMVVSVLGVVLWFLHYQTANCFEYSETEIDVEFSQFDFDRNGRSHVDNFHRFPDRALINQSDENRDRYLDKHEFTALLKSYNYFCTSQHSCEKCLGNYFCRWFPSTGRCHAVGHGLREVLEGRCEIPINTVGQCWSSTYPYRIGDFLALRLTDADAWAVAPLRTMWWPLEPFRTYPEGTTGLFDLATGAALDNAKGGSEALHFVASVSSDWGSGTAEAAVISELMAVEKPDMTIHMGDVYFVGTPKQFDTNVCGKLLDGNKHGISFPLGQQASFLMNGNHETLSGCKGLFENGFGHTGQQTTYAAYQSDKWRLILLDTGYESYATLPLTGGARNVAKETDAPQPKQVFEWLRDVVKLGDSSDKRGIVFFSHHQPYSAWMKDGMGHLGTAKQLQRILPKGREVLWFFGHEHRLAFYRKMLLSDANSGWQADFYVHGRLVGNGGFPNDIDSPAHPDALLAYDNRTYQVVPQPPSADFNIGYNGFFKLNITSSVLNVTYVSAKCKGVGKGDCDAGYNCTHGEVLATETFVVDDSTGALSNTWTSVSTKMTKHRHFENVKASRSPVACKAAQPTHGVMFNLQETLMD